MEENKNRIYQKQEWLKIINDDEYQYYRNKITNAFKDLVFDEGPHKYYLGDKELTCVSNITHLFQEHFDEDRIAEETYERNFENVDSKYYHMTPEQIKASWHKISEEACTVGSERHNFGESILHFMINDFDGIVPEFKDRLHQDENGLYYMEAFFPKEIAVINFWKDIPICIVPILAENKVYIVNEEISYSGTFDIVFYYDSTLDGKPDKMSGLCIYDYKTNKDLYKNFGGKTLLPPFDDLLDMSLNIYKLQLSAYQICLENIGLKILGRRLIWLKPDGTYVKIPLENYSKKLYEALKKIGPK